MKVKKFLENNQSSFNEKKEDFKSIFFDIEMEYNCKYDDYDDYCDDNSLNGIVIIIPHNFYAESSLEDFKKFSKLIKDIDIAIERVIKSDVVSNISFSENSNYEITIIANFKY